MANRARPLPILVLGLPLPAHQAIRRVLELCGARALAPDQLLACQQQWLQEAGADWDSPRELNARWLSAASAEPLEAPLQGLLDQPEATPSPAAPLVLQLPGLERTLPLWQAGFRSVGVEPAHLLILRHPLEVAEALRREHGWSRDRALLVWLQSSLAMERHTRGCSRLVIEQDTLLWDADAVLDQLEQGLGLQLPQRSHERLLAWEQERPEYLAITPTAPRLNSSSPLLAMALELHHYLQAEARGEQRQRHLPDVIYQQLAWGEALYGRVLVEAQQSQVDTERQLTQLSSSRLVRLRQWLGLHRAA